jgi:hypothetical protein
VVAVMPKENIRQKNILERNLVGEGYTKELPPRDSKGKFVSTNKKNNKPKKKVEEVNKPRPIKLTRVKGSYGSFVVKDKKFNEDIFNIIVSAIVIGLLLHRF